MKLQLTPATLAMGEKFTDRMSAALEETGLPREQWHGFVVGWAYGQLRQRMTAPDVRRLFGQLLEILETQLGSGDGPAS